jgi:hypothetical protein
MRPSAGGCTISRIRAAVVKGLMRAGRIVVHEVPAQQTSEMPFVDHDDMIEAFPSNRPDDALGEGILPGRSRGDEDLADPQAFHPPYEHVAVDSVPISEQVLRRCLFRDALDKLVGGPGAVGWSVTLRWTSSRRSCRRIRNPKSKWKVKVGTSSTWRTFLVLATVSPATSWPRNRSSAWIRRRPQVGFFRAMRRISVRNSRSSGGRPSGPATSSASRAGKLGGAKQGRSRAEQ